MNIEERVRQALVADGRSVQVPPRPTTSELHDRSERRLRRWPVAAVAAATVVAVAIAIGVIRPIRVQVDWLVPGEGSETVSFEPSGPDVFATGTVGAASWVAAARVRDDLVCVGMLVEHPSSSDSSVGCGQRRPVPITIGASQARHGVVAVAGTVSDEVARLVWELPDGPIELAIERHPEIDLRLFADAAPVDAPITMLRAYDQAGNPLAAAGINSLPDTADHTGP